MVTSPLSGLIAPVITGAVYALIGVTGIIVVDLITFLLSAAALAVLPIPQPPIAQTKGERRSVWREANAGFEFVWKHKPLLMIFIFTGFTNFFYAGVLALYTPYILSRTGSEDTLGILLGVFSLGSLVGTLLMATWGGTKKRVQTMMPVFGILGVLMAIFGTQSTPLIMAIFLFFMAMASPINNVSIISVLQLKVPPDLQGRVFAAISQISMILIPLSYVVIGPLADTVFEPFAQTLSWSSFAPIFGTGAGAGMGFLITLCGIAIFIVASAIYALPIVRNLETLLPDYTPDAASAPGGEDRAVEGA
jgi:cyanate permease